MTDNLAPEAIPDDAGISVRIKRSGVVITCDDIGVEAATVCSDLKEMIISENELSVNAADMILKNRGKTISDDVQMRDLYVLK